MGSQAELRLLDGFELSVDGAPIHIGGPAQRLVALLAVSGVAMTRLRVAATLWPDRQESRAVANLRSALWRIPPVARFVVTAEYNQVSLSAEVACDAAEAQHAARAAIDGNSEFGNASDASDVVRLLRRRLLPGWYDDWVVFEQEHTAQLRLHALEAICRQLSAAGEHLVALEAGAAAVEVDGLAESAHRVLAEAYLAAGNMGAARRVFERFRVRLDHEMNAAPTDSFRRLVDTHQ